VRGEIVSRWLGYAPVLGDGDNGKVRSYGRSRENKYDLNLDETEVSTGDVLGVHRSQQSENDQTQPHIDLPRWWLFRLSCIRGV
jgi:hypothetical protein